MVNLEFSSSRLADVRRCYDAPIQWETKTALILGQNRCVR